MLTLAELMKEHEHAFRRRLDPGKYVLIRLDGKAFHSYTKRLEKPFDRLLMDAMDETMIDLCERVQGVRFGYVESDEISLLLTSWRTVPESAEYPDGRKAGELWMGGVEAKLLSLTAAMATAKFNAVRHRQAQELGLTGDALISFHREDGIFDSRVWTFDGDDEGRRLVREYFGWRRRDSIKNSVTMAALDAFSHKEIHGCKTEEKVEMLRAAGKPWEDLPLGFQFGRTAHKAAHVLPVTYVDKRTDETVTTKAVRTKWELSSASALADEWDEERLPS